MIDNNLPIPLLEIGRTYLSLRDSGFDFPTAVGELLDNSIQAEAKTIDIYTIALALENRSVISQVLVADDGCGMNADTLHHSLKLGYSTRYNDRGGLGRFGVGATLAAISQCKRINIFSRTSEQESWLTTFIDLDEISQDNQSSIPYPTPLTLASHQLESLLKSTHGTIVSWDKTDRLQTDPNGRPIDEADLVEELIQWISRAYRYFLWSGITIRINNQEIIAHDPLYLNPTGTKFPQDPPALIRFSDTLDWPVPRRNGITSPIKITVTLLPQELRQEAGAGGKPAAKERRIPENEGISILRHQREVAFGNFYPMLPSTEDIDRWWGCEIEFEPDLDECWEVRNVKRGARPIKELRDELRKIVSSRINGLRQEIKSYWKKIRADQSEIEGTHSIPESVVQEVEQERKPATQAGNELTRDEQEKKKEDISNDPDLPPQEQDILKQKISGPDPLPITVKSKAMAGAEFMQTEHIGNGQIVITFNKDHPFFSEVYAQLEISANPSLDSDETLMTIRYAIDLLLMAYGRAESMIDLNNPTVEEAVTELRSYWGVQLRKYINHLTRMVQ